MVMCMFFLLLSGRVVLEHIDLSGRYVPAGSVRSTIDAYAVGPACAPEGDRHGPAAARWMLRRMCIMVT